MSTCIICLDSLKSPVALPCGHVFCQSCITCQIQAGKVFTVQHACPTCRRPYTILSVDPSLCPPQFRPHITSPIRKLYLEESSPKSSTHLEPEEFTRLRAENAALKSLCVSWRKRAEAHGAATLGMIGLARTARNHAVRMQDERDDARERYSALKRKLEDPESATTFSPSSSCFNKTEEAQSFPPPTKRARNTPSASISVSITTQQPPRSNLIRRPNA